MASPIVAEETPNPLALRISTGKPILGQPGWLEFTDLSQAHNSPLAERMLFFKFVDRIFLSESFFTLIRKPEYEWEMIIEEIREAVDLFLNSGLPATHDVPHSDLIIENSQETRLTELLTFGIRQATLGDGGILIFDRIENGTLWLNALGACAGCPHLSETIGKGIEPVFLREFNFIHQVKVNSPG